MSDKLNWANMLVEKNELQRAALAAYDDCIQGGYDQEEARAFVRGNIPSSVNMWPLVELWFNRERPLKTQKEKT